MKKAHEHERKCKNYNFDKTSHEENRDSKCDSCGKPFSDPKALQTHICTGKRDNKCASCGKTYFDASTLKRHIHTVHEGHKDYKCDSCGKSFSLAGNLKKHIRKFHGWNLDQKIVNGSENLLHDRDQE